MSHVVGTCTFCGYRGAAEGPAEECLPVPSDGEPGLREGKWDHWRREGGR